MAEQEELDPQRAVEIQSEQTPEPKTEPEPAPYDFSRLEGTPKGFVPLPTNVAGKAEGSLWKANFRDSTTIGSFINSPQSKLLDIDDADRPDMETLINNIPDDKLEFAPRYLGRRLEDFDEITKTIDREQEDKQLIASHPYKSFGIGFFEQVALEPVNWLPFGSIFQNANRSSKFLKTIVQSGATASAAATAQESIIQKNQLTREAQESAFNIATSGLLGAALGGIGVGLNVKGKPKSLEQRQARAKARNEIMDVYTDKDKPLSPDGILNDENIANMPKLLQKTMLSTPMNRGIKSQFETAKWFNNRMYDNNYTLDKHLDGQTLDHSIERLVRQDHKKLDSILVQYDDIFYKLNDINKGPFRGTRAKLQGLSWTKEDFDTAVWETLSTDETHETPEVNEAARLWREEVFDSAANRLIKGGVLPEDDSPRNAANYVMSVWNKDKIVEQGGKKARHEGSLPDTLHKEFKAIREEIRAFRRTPIFKENTEKIEKTKEKLADLKEKKRKLKTEDKEKRKKINERIKKIKEDIESFENEIRKNAPQKGLDSNGKLFKMKTDKKLWTDVEQTIDNILGDNEGVLVNPMLEKIKSNKPDPLKHRKMTVEQVKLREWQSTNMANIGKMYVRATSPVVHLTELAQKNGFKDINEFKAGIEKSLKEEFDIKSKGKSGTEAQKLRNERDQMISDMNATFQLVEGVYGDGPNTLNNSAKKYAQNFLKWNATRLLGFMTMSSFPDVGIQVMKHGPYRFIHDGLVRSMSQMRQMTKTDLQGMGYGIDTEVGSRLHSFADTQGLTTNPGPFTKAFDAMSKKFGNLSLMNQWNDLMTNIAGHMGINRTLQTVHKVVQGESVPEKELLRLRQLGVKEKHFNTLFEFTKNNIDDDGAIWADWSNWDIQTPKQAEALEAFQAAVGKEIDNIVIVPGLGDKPLLARSLPGQIILQFKSFLMAATNRVLTSGIQNRNDINTYLGVATMLGLGAFSYVTTSLVRGNEPDLSFENLSKEAIDKSGILGIYGEFANIGAKAFGYRGSSRYQSRDLTGGFLGPAFGAASEVISVMQKVEGIVAGNETITTKDAQKFLRLFPFQNLGYIHQLNRKVMKGAAKELGAVEVDD